MSHRAQAFGTGATQQLEQYRLGLIVPMMGQRERFVAFQRSSESRETRRTRRIFQTRSGCAFNRHAGDFEWHADVRCKASTLLRPLRAVSVQAVIHMQRTQASLACCGNAGKNVQQNAGIKAAAERDDDAAGRKRGETFFYG